GGPGALGAGTPRRPRPVAGRPPRRAGEWPGQAPGRSRLTHDHRYTTTCTWSGSTAAGYEQYERDHTAAAPPAAARLELSGDPAFRGDPGRLNPEQLLVMAASSCQLLSFLAAAARARVDVIGYQD